MPAARTAGGTFSPNLPASPHHLLVATFIAHDRTTIVSPVPKSTKLSSMQHPQRPNKRQSTLQQVTFSCCSYPADGGTHPSQVQCFTAEDH